MKRLLALALTCLLAACTSQHRVDPEPDFTNPDPAPDVTPEQPRQGEIESLISQARLEIKRRDYDEARVKLHQVFRRDRWHPEANTIYQDLQISRGKGDALYQEYLDLYEANKQRGDALWFHLRPLLIKRGIKACEVEKEPEQSEEVTARINAVLSEADPVIEAGPGQRTVPTLAEARGSLKTLLDKEVLTHRQHLFLALAWFAHGSEKVGDLELHKYYESRVEENPVSGDMLAVLATVTARMSARIDQLMFAIDLLHRGWILELPGIQLPMTFSSLCAWRARALPVAPDKLEEQDVFRERRGWECLALNLFLTAVAADKNNRFGTKEALEMTRAFFHSNRDEIEDLSQRK